MGPTLSGNGRTLHRSPETSMLDLVLVAIGVGFFAASILYVSACDRL